MPRCRRFLQTNGPWDQLISLGNIVVNSLAEDSIVQVTERVQALPIRVPHRDEYSETVGYRIMGPNHTVLFIPDIDKWERWEHDLKQELSLVDRAYLDATFFDASEVGYRDMSEIPHPFMVETMDFLGALSAAEKSKVHFIHMNHTNPCLSDTSFAYRHVVASGFHIARMGDAYPL
jgi:pyrroloquinoline quinone biosynthesis protein B